MKNFLSKEHYYYNVNTPLMKSSAYLPSSIDNPFLWITHYPIFTRKS